MKLPVREIVIGVVVLAGASLLAGRCYSARADEWETRVQVGLQAAEDQRSRAEAFKAEAERLRSQAVATAEAAEAREPIIRERIVALPPPVTARDTAADEIIEELEENRDDFKLAYQLEVKAHNETIKALRLEELRGDSLYSLLVVRPSKKPWYLPELVVGPSVGVCTDSRPCAGVMVTLGWKIKL
jgi:outer membrane murein-binding lipoprotein Lpp